MKKVFKFLSAAAILSLTFTSVNASEFADLDVKKECDVKANGIEKVMASAEKYNKVAKEHKVEFMRLGMKTSQYIEGAQEALKNGSKEVAILDEKAKPTGEKVTVEFAAWRSCSFAISALTQEAQAKTTWKLASPSDGYKY